MVLAGGPLEHSCHSCCGHRGIQWILSPGILAGYVCLQCPRWGEKPGCRCLGPLAGGEMLRLWDAEG